MMGYVIGPELVKYLPTSIVPIAVQNFTPSIGAGGYDFPKFPPLYPPRRHFEGKEFKEAYADILKRNVVTDTHRFFMYLACNAYVKSVGKFEFDSIPTYALVSRNPLQRKMLAVWLGLKLVQDVKETDIGKEMIEKWQKENL